MATLTPTQTFAEPSHNVGGVWEYSVPLDDEQYLSHESQPAASHNSSQRQHYANGISHQRDGDLLVPNRVSNLRTKSSDLSNGSDPDSLLDLYKSPSNPSMRSAPLSGSKNVRKTSSGALSRSPEEDESNWIHRDKLAQIESRELIEAGLRIGRRPSERFDSKRDEKRQRLVSPERANADADEYVADDTMSTTSKSFLPKPATARGASSRIPIPKSVSPSATYAESSTDARSRSGSAGLSGSVEQSPQSPQIGFEMNETNENSPPDTPPARTNSATASSKSSPQKTVRNPKAAPNSRKAPRNASNPKAKVSNFKPPKEEPKRPGTSSGNTPLRPPTSHRTDGEPPWLATMYKPDPRLPPDQQMLPTLAKKLAQEQWEKEGKTGTVYDRNFQLLNVEAFPPKPPSPERKTSMSTAGANDDGVKTTILNAGIRNTPPSSSPRTPSSIRPGTSGTDGHGGYKTMPTIPSPKPQSPPGVISISNQQQQAPIPPKPQATEMQGIKSERPQQAPEEKEKETGCGCGCVIM